MLGMPVQALRELRSIDHRQPVAFEWHRLRGLILRSQERHEEALGDLERAHQLQPEHIDVLMALAWCYKRTNQLARSIEATQAAHAVQPEEPILLYNLACYHSLAGDSELALSWLARAFRMSPGLVSLVAGESDFDPLRDDSRFHELLRMVQAPG